MKIRSSSADGKNFAVPMSLVETVAPRTGKFIKNDLTVYERGENLLQNGIHVLHFVFCQKSRWKVRIFFF